MNIPKYSHISSFNILHNTINYTQVNPTQVNPTQNTITHHTYTYDTNNTDIFTFTHNFLHYSNLNTYSNNIFKHTWKDNCSYQIQNYELNEKYQDYDYLNEYEQFIDSDNYDSDSSFYSTDDESDFEYV